MQEWRVKWAHRKNWKEKVLSEICSIPARRGREIPVSFVIRLCRGRLGNGGRMGWVSSVILNRRNFFETLRGKKPMSLITSNCIKCPKYKSALNESTQNQLYPFNNSNPQLNPKSSPQKNTLPNKNTRTIRNRKCPCHKQRQIPVPIWTLLLLWPQNQIISLLSYSARKLGKILRRMRGLWGIWRLMRFSSVWSVIGMCLPLRSLIIIRHANSLWLCSVVRRSIGRGWRD